MSNDVGTLNWRVTNYFHSAQETYASDTQFVLSPLSEMMCIIYEGVLVSLDFNFR